MAAAAGGAGGCPLCRAGKAAPFTRDRRRAYVRCAVCALVYVPREFHVDAAQERAEYERHENR